MNEAKFDVVRRAYAQVAAIAGGQPSFVTMLIALGRPAAGEHAVHVGAGVGY